jgi:hypothetical protein
MLKKIAVSASTTVLAAASLALAGATIDSAAAAGTCPNNDWSNITDVLVTNNFRNDGVNIRTGDSTSCTSLGQGQQTHDTRLHCYSWNGSNFWDHLRDRNTGVSGWVREDQLYVVSGNAC